MDITHFVFAFYVFLLVGVLIWFYARVTRGGKKKDSGAQEKEQHLFKLYQNVEDMLGGFEEYAEEARTAIDERLKQAEALIAQARSAADGKAVPMAAMTVPEGAADTKPVQETRVPEVPARKESKQRPEAAAKKAVGKRAAEPAENKPEQEDRAEIKPPQRTAKSAVKARQNVDELIPQYIAEGLSKEEIARTLGISTREVLLIMQVKKIGMKDGQD